jgi:hypothetical protein
MGYVFVSGYGGALSLAMRDAADDRVQFHGLAVEAGSMPTDYATAPTFTVPIWIIAEGGMRRDATLTVTVEQAATALSVTLRQTDVQAIDLRDALAPCPDFNMVTVASAGAIKAQPWQMRELLPGQTRTYTKRELSNMFAVSTEAATVDPAAGTLTISFKDGESETGSTLAVVVNIAVTDAVSLTHDHGAKSGARWGGFDLRQLGSGPWTLVSQSTAGALEIFDDRVTFAPVAGTAGNTYGTRFLTAPATGPGAYTVTVNSAATGNKTITFNVIPNRYSIGPQPAPIPLNLGNYQMRSAMRATDKNWGDEIVLEDGEYGVAGEIIIVGAPTQRVGGPPPPVEKGDPGWITFRSKRYLGARFSSGHEFSTQNLRAPFMRFRDIDLADGGVRIQAFNNAMSGSDLHFEYLRGASASLGTGVKDQGEWDRIHVNDCWFSGSAACIYVRAWDSEIIGNYMQYTIEDSYKCSILNRVAGSGKAKFWFNISVDHKYADPSGKTHSDFAQFVLTGGTLPAMTSSIGEFEAPSFYGNVMFRGDGTFDAPSGTYWRDGQGFFCNDLEAGCSLKLRFRANAVSSNMRNGIYWPEAATGSRFDYCTIVPPYGAFDRPWAGTLTVPRFVVKGLLAGTVELTNSLMAANPIVEDGVGVINQTNNYIGLSTFAAGDAMFTDAATWNDVPDIEVLLAKLTVKDPAHQDKGALADPLIDIRQRWVAPELLA